MKILKIDNNTKEERPQLISICIIEIPSFVSIFFILLILASIIFGLSFGTKVEDMHRMINVKIDLPFNYKYPQTLSFKMSNLTLANKFVSISIFFKRQKNISPRKVIISNASFNIYFEILRYSKNTEMRFVNSKINSSELPKPLREENNSLQPKSQQENQLCDSIGQKDDKNGQKDDNNWQKSYVNSQKFHMLSKSSISPSEQVRKILNPNDEEIHQYKFVNQNLSQTKKRSHKANQLFIFKEGKLNSCSNQIFVLYDINNVDANFKIEVTSSSHNYSCIQADVRTHSQIYGELESKFSICAGCIGCIVLLIYFSQIAIIGFRECQLETKIILFSLPFVFITSDVFVWVFEISSSFLHHMSYISQSFLWNLNKLALYVCGIMHYNSDSRFPLYTYILFFIIFVADAIAAEFQYQFIQRFGIYSDTFFTQTVIKVSFNLISFFIWTIMCLKDDRRGGIFLVYFIVFWLFQAFLTIFVNSLDLFGRQFFYYISNKIFSILFTIFSVVVMFPLYKKRVIADESSIISDAYFWHREDQL
ncbi:hypothetical protein TRFO_02104 [Tritrichomonas foetus]|uniref:Uncharacterized protein n=1 Tax=Tritrichomonas foetus TaxID=1144522 RepID=A0A1J4JH75_9EUKA|nr:hypothetical protein TRFO_02104 [Tritrichomonas foetus]|eukprot:OHS96955.1 hypothetical protein TRFO_02104 [Tritrichomonas foetus]